MLDGAAGDIHGRLPARPGNCRVLRPLLGLRAPLREALMSLEYGIGLALSVLLLVYLSWALVKPEHF
ncbi:MAG: potassium-transporting ATPase subunit F [Deltaproteobacteria bacterium]|nr:MAG: potassium-transporting ATPase subunit F [Deltaproteobacteria bacterium]TMB35668.1 MAG: potassium-transporting ATPase subunit F [Deltaproteobacteria bacterium]